MGRGDFYGGWAPYVPVAERRRQAERAAAKQARKGQAMQPVRIRGRKIASSFWGGAWCDNLESYSDYENRLPRGRTYVRNGSVIDLRVEAGKVRALVSGSDIYRVEVDVDAVDAEQWRAIVGECTGKVGSLVEVLQGRLSKGVMAVVTRPGNGLFPQPRQMRFSCSCPDWASMCKHVAATLYGVGSRLDAEPELLFKLRHVRAEELVEQAVGIPVAAEPAGALAGSDLAALFGIEIAEAGSAAAAQTLPETAVKTTAKARAGTAGQGRGKPPQTMTGKASGRQRAAEVAAKPASAKAAKPASAKAAALTRPPARKAMPKSTPKSTPKGAVKSSPVVAKAAAKPPTKPARARTITAAELLARRVPRHMIQSWLASGVLAPGPQRGVYRTTAQTEARIRAYLARAAAR